MARGWRTAIASAGMAAALACVPLAPRRAVEATRKRTDPDLAWVCAQHDLVTDFSGHITFEDVRRSLCYLGRYGGPLDLPMLQRAALAEARRCDASPEQAILGWNQPPRTIRDLYSALEVAFATDGRNQECASVALLTGLVRSLGDEYRFRPIGELSADPRTDQAPTPSLLNQTIVYVKFPRFLNSGRRVIEEALRDAREDHPIRGLMLDLRGSDGAPVQELARFLDLFFDDGVVLAWRSRLDGQIDQETATRSPPAETIPMVVIVDERTGSGAEAFAGVLRARGPAVLIGRRTMGRALVQTVIDLPSGSHLVLPVGDLLEPGVGVITGLGVKPDFEVGTTPARPEAADEDAAILFGVRLLLAARSNTRADLLEAGRRAAVAPPRSNAAPSRPRRRGTRPLAFGSPRVPAPPVR